MKVCIDCKREVPQVNRKGRCPNCATTAMVDSILNLKRREGPYWERWKERYEAWRESRRVQ